MSKLCSVCPVCTSSCKVCEIYSIYFLFFSRRVGIRTEQREEAYVLFREERTIASRRMSEEERGRGRGRRGERGEREFRLVKRNVEVTSLVLKASRVL